MMSRLKRRTLYAISAAKMIRWLTDELCFPNPHLQYVEEIIELLELQDLADAMIGFVGFGLNVEARKRLTIGVELAAKPQLLLFLDEPTSGLDGQSAFNIVRFLRKLAAGGQAILCTIHQPNAMLFENFGAFA